jgi:hypothetical protein
MAITTGVGPHAAWLNCNGTWPVEHGTVDNSSKRKTSRFSCTMPLSYPGAYAALANLGDNDATISVLARGAVATLFTGEVDDVAFDYIARTIHVTGRDKSKKLHDKKSNEKFLNQKTSDIVNTLIGRVGLSGDVFSSGNMAGKKLEQDYVKLTSNLNYAQIISKLAYIDGARWWVDQNGLFHYAPYGSPTGNYSISINQDQEPISSDALKFRIRRNIEAGKTIKVTVKSWHPKKKQVFQSEKTVEGNGGPIEYEFHLPTMQQQDVDARATARANGKAQHEFKVTATVVGDPSVTAGMGLSVSGTTFFDQTYDIDHTSHVFGMDGYLTHITARSPKKGRSAS